MYPKVGAHPLFSSVCGKMTKLGSQLFRRDSPPTKFWINFASTYLKLPPLVLNWKARHNLKVLNHHTWRTCESRKLSAIAQTRLSAILVKEQVASAQTIGN